MESSKFRIIFHLILVFDLSEEDDDDDFKSS